MKNVLAMITVLGVIFLSSCGSIEWTEEMEAEFKKQCLEKMAKQAKAENPDEFCKCFVQKMKEEEMGAMDMITGAAKLMEACGANVNGEAKEEADK